MSPLEQLNEWQSEAQAIRRRIHRHPELGFEERNTQALVVEHLTAYGVDEICTDFAETAVVAVIHGNQGPGKRIGLRADMDALPIDEENTFEHKSGCAGKMHACGHDGHTTMLLMAARYLALHKDFKGTAVLFFQPAEEGVGGAERMIHEGVLERFPVDSCFALHNMPGIPAGQFAFREGPIMASSDRLFITVKGDSGHAGLPHKTRDPLLVATHIYQGIQALVSRTFSPLEPVVISVTQIHGGETTNAIADEAHISGTFRTLAHDTRNNVITRLETLVPNLAKAFEMEAEFRLGPISHPPTVNTPAETAMAVQAATAVAGEAGVDGATEPLMGSEDFAYFLGKVPGCYGFIGNGSNDPGCSVGLHNKRYDFNDSIIPAGAAYFVTLVHQMG
ncbi:M20 aminoacylase family protein [Oceanisphaera psychrotolerans]|uniref:Peptidase M20 n=1 Tax=Oceanisphaera psychrotolerans TaxID=1414654 RepID=A0A1J4QCV6_9GAMM|nr:M20 aminoacylase family protein [Oceanisphaera psychrotolerans]OIN08532.1 peptidase M20 [Oceanisphaera psychrotolerans]